MTNIISADDAQKIASNYLLRLELEIGEPLQLVCNETIEKNFGWVFFYNSKFYLETGDFRHMLVGNSPFIIDKNNGVVSETGTSKPIEDYISDYENDNWGQRGKVYK